VLSNAAQLVAGSVNAVLLAGSAGVAGSADGAGTAARFNTPNYLTQARDGRIAIGDFSNSTIRLVATNGDVSTLAGSPGAFGFADGSGSAARFNGNGGVAFDSAGNLFVSDWDNHVIRRITPAGVVSTFAGTAGAAGSTDGTGAAARFSNPNGLAIDAADNVYVVDWGNHTLRKITPAGVVSTLAGSPGVPGSADGSGAAARFRTPGAVAVDAAGNLYVTDMFNHAIRKVTPAGDVSTLAGTLGLSGTVDAVGSAARFEQPAWIASAADGTLFVVSATGDTVRRVSSGGAVSTVVGVAGDNATLRLGSNPRLRNARGVWAVSSTELLIAADQTLIRVRLP
jgi:sugar lactone lactonase YvrE